ncbi:hypothetical protein Bca52824_031892 [Brassica carinata]|uniref:Uncharacterized protein n=1 Tax=Brassica carinata TaxID=52824 RepID=A0A8X7V723_BRACI|nr:hypothetical protein Bca52824_031892 [Brassica carinata]
MYVKQNKKVDEKGSNPLNPTLILFKYINHFIQKRMNVFLEYSLQRPETERDYIVMFESILRIQKHSLSHEIDNYPEPDDEGTIRVTARIFGQDDNSTFTTLLLAKDFIFDENDGCKSNKDLIYFLVEAGINGHDIRDAILKLTAYLDGVTFPASIEYFPECALIFRLDLVPDYLDDDSRVQEAEDLKGKEEEDDKLGRVTDLFARVWQWRNG